jgi:hypothetical protein
VAYADGVSRCHYCAKDASAQSPDEVCNGPLPLRIAAAAPATETPAPAAGALLSRVLDECVTNAGSDDPQFYPPTTGLLSDIVSYLADKNVSPPAPAKASAAAETGKTATNYTGRRKEAPDDSNKFIIHQDESGYLGIHIAHFDGDESYLYLFDDEMFAYGLGTITDFKKVMDEFFAFAAGEQTVAAKQGEGAAKRGKR